MANWIGKYVFIGLQVFKIDWMRDGHAGLSYADNPESVKVIEASEIRAIYDAAGVRKETRRLAKERSVRKLTSHSPRVEVEKLLARGLIDESDINTLLELYGYESADDVRPGDWTLILEDFEAVINANHKIAAEFEMALKPYDRAMVETTMKAFGATSFYGCRRRDEILSALEAKSKMH
ncbi:hypothetical protein [Aestuariivirga sp.]|uniref:hypothetical protein n=1 Tax=Aestuariivirga sp. TaxID=2650926 RepID=UPI0035941389